MNKNLNNKNVDDELYKTYYKNIKQSRQSNRVKKTNMDNEKSTIKFYEAASLGEPLIIMTPDGVIHLHEDYDWRIDGNILIPTKKEK